MEIPIKIYSKTPNEVIASLFDNDKQKVIEFEGGKVQFQKIGIEETEGDFGGNLIQIVFYYVEDLAKELFVKWLIPKLDGLSDGIKIGSQKTKVTEKDVQTTLDDYITKTKS